MHDKHFIAIRIDLLGPRRISEPRFFLHGQTVHVGPEHHQGTFAVLKQRNDPRATDITGHRITQRCQLIRQPRRRFVLHGRKFRVLVEVEKQLFEFVVVNRLDLGIERLIRYQARRDDSHNKG